MDIDLVKLSGTHVLLELLTPAHRETIRPLAKNEVIWEFNKMLPIDEDYDAAFDAYLGAIKEGVLRKHGHRNDGSIRHTVVYSIIDDEWFKQKKIY